MAKLRQLRSDVAAERDGVWAEYEDGFEIKIASSATREFRDAIDRALEPYLDLIRQGKLSSDEREKVVRDVGADLLVRDWRGLENDDGTPATYSRQSARELLADPAMHRVWTFVQAVAGSDTRYREARSKAALGN